MDNTEILIKVRKIVRSINLESKRILKAYGVSIPQILCLNFLYKAKNCQSTQNEIRKFLNLNSSTVTGIVNRLERENLVARLPKSGDKRVSNIALTSKGEKLINQVPPLLHEQLSDKLNKLSAEEHKKLEQSLDTLIKMLDIEEVEASPMIVLDDSLEGDSETIE